MYDLVVESVMMPLYNAKWYYLVLRFKFDEYGIGINNDFQHEVVQQINNDDGLLWNYWNPNQWITEMLSFHDLVSPCLTFQHLTTCLKYFILNNTLQLGGWK